MTNSSDKNKKSVSSDKSSGKRQKKETKSGIFLDIFDISGKKVGRVKVSKEVFASQVSRDLLAQYARVYLSRQRMGTANSKSRSDVVGSTRKIYRQKGTGRARHSDRKAPIFVGGGKAHGPNKRDFSLNISKKQRRKALHNSLTVQFVEKNIIVVKGVSKLEPKTKKFVEMLQALNLSDKKRILFVYSSDSSKNAALSCRNLEKVDSIEARVINPYAVMKADCILMEDGTVEVIEGISQQEK